MKALTGIRRSSLFSRLFHYNLIFKIIIEQIRKSLFKFHHESRLNPHFPCPSQYVTIPNILFRVPRCRKTVMTFLVNSYLLPGKSGGFVLHMPLFLAEIWLDHFFCSNLLLYYLLLQYINKLYWAIVWLTTGQSVRAFNGVISTSSVISYFSLFLSNRPKNGQKQFWRLRLYSKYSRRPIFINLKNTFFYLLVRQKQQKKWKMSHPAERYSFFATLFRFCLNIQKI